jgi:acylphosphatase
MAGGVRCVVFGKVQGVWFRAWTRDLAVSLGLRGFVRNRADGSVEAYAEGEAEPLETFRQRLAEGPPLARVERVETQAVDSGEECRGFEIRR